MERASTSSTADLVDNRRGLNEKSKSNFASGVAPTTATTAAAKNKKAIGKNSNFESDQAQGSSDGFDTPKPEEPLQPPYRRRVLFRGHGCHGRGHERRSRRSRRSRRAGGEFSFADMVAMDEAMKGGAGGAGGADDVQEGEFSFADMVAMDEAMKGGAGGARALV